MTKSEFEKLPTAEEMHKAMLANPALCEDKEVFEIINRKAEKEFEEHVIDAFGSYDPEIHYDFSKKKKD